MGRRLHLVDYNQPNYRIALECFDVMAIPLRRKLAYSSLVTAGFFLILEATLWVIGVRPVTDTRDPFVGFAAAVPLFEATIDDTSRMATATNKLPWFNPQSFPAAKAEGTYRIFSLGGSTTFGRPFRDPTSYTGCLREYLREAIADREYEVINAGGVSYASYRVANVMRELAQYEPDLFIVYTAQNEFLEWRTYEDIRKRPAVGTQIAGALSQTRTWAVVDRLTQPWRKAPPEPKRFILAGEVNEILNHTVGPTSYERDATWSRQVLQHYEVNLNRMVDIAERCGAKIVLVTPASNMKDCTPFKSMGGDALSEDDAKRIEQIANDAQMLLEIEQAGPARDLLEQAVTLDPQNALLHFRLGHAHLQLNDASKALHEFQLAIDEDVCPLRAVREIPEIVRRVASQRNVYCVDFEKKLGDECESRLGHRCFGDELFLDHVHPNREAHSLLGQWLFGALVDIGATPPNVSLTPTTIKVVDERLKDALTLDEQMLALRNLAKVLHWAGKFDEAAPLALQVLEHHEDDMDALVVAADCLRETGQGGAVELYQRILAIDPMHCRSHVRLGQLFADDRDWKNSQLHLSVALSIDPEIDFALRELGAVCVELGEYEKAVDAFQRAEAISPNDAATCYYLGKVHAHLEQLDQSEAYFRKAAEMNPQDSQIQNELGLVLMKQKRLKEAKACFEEALRLRPDFEEALINLESLLDAVDAKVD